MGTARFQQVVVAGDQTRSKAVMAFASPGHVGKHGLMVRKSQARYTDLSITPAGTGYETVNALALEKAKSWSSKGEQMPNPIQGIHRLPSSRTRGALSSTGR